MIYLKTTYSLALNQISTFAISLEAMLLPKINFKKRITTTKKNKKPNKITQRG